jgi:hypothetical protein
MKFLSKGSIERTFWVALLAAGIYATVFGANYVRDHKVYKEAAAKCSITTSALAQEVENALVAKEQVAQENEQLKNLGAR